jgi:hypothetical protein
MTTLGSALQLPAPPPASTTLRWAASTQALGHQLQAPWLPSDGSPPPAALRVYVGIAPVPCMRRLVAQRPVRGWGQGQGQRAACLAAWWWAWTKRLMRKQAGLGVVAWQVLIHSAKGCKTSCCGSWLASTACMVVCVTHCVWLGMTLRVGWYAVTQWCHGVRLALAGASGCSG